jgi:hypothetical protein
LHKYDGNVSPAASVAAAEKIIAKIAKKWMKFLSIIGC